MAHKAPITDGDGNTVGSVTGRGRLYGRVTDIGAGRIRIRLDDEARADWWAELSLSVDMLKPQRVEAERCPVVLIAEE